MKHFILYDGTGKIIVTIKTSGDYVGEDCIEVSESDATASPPIEKTHRVDVIAKTLVKR